MFETPLKTPSATVDDAYRFDTRYGMTICQVGDCACQQHGFPTIFYKKVG